MMRLDYQIKQNRYYSWGWVDDVRVFETGYDKRFFGSGENIVHWLVEISEKPEVHFQGPDWFLEIRKLCRNQLVCPSPFPSITNIIISSPSSSTSLMDVIHVSRLKDGKMRSVGGGRYGCCKTATQEEMSIMWGRGRRRIGIGMKEKKQKQTKNDAKE